MGLRFLKQNVPEIEILEYPSWKSYASRISEGWDVVGFSFFENEIGEILEMIKEARRQGIREIWAGGYGVLNPVVSKTVDRVFLGASEDSVASIFGYRIADDEVIHPAMAWPIVILPGRIPYMKVGLLYTRHGCPFSCSFCQTPLIDRKRIGINIESIDRVLRYYKEHGFTDVFIADELFGLHSSSADTLTRMLARYRLRWWAQSRAAIFLKYLDQWYERGLRFPMIGLESMSQKSLDLIHKQQKVEDVEEYARRTAEKPGVYRIVDWMIGYENMTAEDTVEDARLLKRLGFEAHGVSVLTPFPETPLWKKLESKYGIIKSNYRDFDTKHLVWNHPYISRKGMLYLRSSLINYLNNPMDAYIKPFSKLIRDRFREQGFKFIWRDIIKNPVAAVLYDDGKQFFFPPSRTPRDHSMRRKNQESGRFRRHGQFGATR